MITSKIATVTLSHTLSESFSDESTGLARGLVAALSSLELEHPSHRTRLEIFERSSHSMHWDAEWPDKALYIASMEDGRAMQTLYRVQELQVPIIFVRTPESSTDAWEFYLFHPEMKRQGPDLVLFNLNTGLEGDFTEVEFLWGELPPSLKSRSSES